MQLKAFRPPQGWALRNRRQVFSGSATNKECDENRYMWCGFEAFLARREIRRVIRIAFQKEKRWAAAFEEATARRPRCGSLGGVEMPDVGMRKASG
jgi:hypothetical protein